MIYSSSSYSHSSESEPVGNPADKNTPKPKKIATVSPPAPPMPNIQSRGSERAETKNIQEVKHIHERVRPKWGRIIYVWEIDCFWELRALASLGALGSAEHEEEVVWSSTFGTPTLGYWRLKCYPYGDHSPAGRQQVSLFLSLDTLNHPEQSAYAMFGCSVLGSDGKELPGSSRTFTRQRFKADANSWGWSQFVKDEGHSISRMLTDSNKLIIRCYIDVYTGLQRTPILKERPVHTFQEDVIAHGSTNSDVSVYYGPLNNRTCYKGCAFLIKARTKRLLQRQDSNSSHTDHSNDKRVDRTELYPDIEDTTLIKYDAALECIYPDILIDPSFTPAAVEAFLTEIHVGTNAIVNAEAAASHDDIKTILEILHLSYITGFTSLYWQSAQLLANKMITEHDAKMIAKYAKLTKCDPLYQHAEGCLRISFTENRDQLLDCLLPDSHDRELVLKGKE